MQLVLDPAINLHSNNHHLISRSFQLKVTKAEIQRWSTCTAAILDFPFLKIAKRHYFKCQNYNVIRRIWYVFIIKEQLFRNWSKGKIFKLKKIERGFTEPFPSRLDREHITSNIVYFICLSLRIKRMQYWTSIIINNQLLYLWSVRGIIYLWLKYVTLMVGQTITFK